MTRVLPSGWSDTGLPGGKCPRCRAQALLIRRQRVVGITTVTDFGSWCSQCEWEVLPPDKV